MKKTVFSLSLVDPAKVKKDDRISKMAQQLIVGGYDWEIELPEVVITCGQNEGQCWECIWVNVGEYTNYCRKCTGKQSDYCYSYMAPAKCKDLGLPD